MNPIQHIRNYFIEPADIHPSVMGLWLEEILDDLRAEITLPVKEFDPFEEIEWV